MHKLSLILIVSFQLLITSLSLHAQTNLYVSKQGSDHNKGTLNAPLQSIQQALVLANQESGQVTITLRRGTYVLDTTLIINATTFSPTSLIICNYKTESVVISGGKKLELDGRLIKMGSW